MKSSTSRALVAKKQSTSFAQVATNLLNVLQGCSKSIRLLLVMFLTLTVTTNAWGVTYTKITSTTGLPADGSSAKYLIVYESLDYVYDGSKTGDNLGASGDYKTSGNTTFTRYGSTITIKGTDNFYFTISRSGNNYIIQSASGHYIGRTQDSNGLNQSTSTSYNHTIAFSNNNAQITSSGGPKLQFLNSKGSYTFKYYKTSQQLVQLYKLDASCDKKVTIVKGTPETGGSFNLDKTGAQDCCSALTVTVSNITAPSGKEFDAITQSGIATGVTINQSAKTVTYAANSTGPSTINVTFRDLPKYTVTLKDNEETLTQASAGAAVILPPRTGCTGYTFAGWTKTWVAPQSLWTTTAPTIIPADSYTPSANENLYPVYTKTEGGGGSSTGGITQSEITTASEGKTAGNYGAQSASSASGNWTGKYAWNTQNSKKVMQLNATSGNSIISPTFSGAISNISFVYTNASNSNRTFYLKDGDTSIGSISASSKTTEGSGSASISGTHTSFEITASDALYIHSITVTYTGGSTTYYISVPDCGAPCTDAVTISKGTETNGTFTLSTTGDQSTCNGSVTVTLSDIEPATGYQFSAITQTGINSGVTIDNTAKTVTYAQNTTGTSTINVTFIEIPKYTVTFNAGSGTCDDESLTEASGGAGVTLPTANPRAACATDGWEFAGWWTGSVAETTTSPGELLTADSNYKPASNCTLYAVYSYTEAGGGGTENVSRLYTFSKFPAGIQYAENEEHELEEDVLTLFTTQCHFTTELRIYSSDAHNGYVVSNQLPGRIISIGFNAGDNVDAIDVFGSTNGTDWTKVGQVIVTSTSYKDYTLSFGATNYTYFKLDVAGSTQVRLKSMTITWESTSGGGSSTTTYNSNPDCGPQQLETPNVNVSEISTSSAKLSWSAVPNAVGGYSIVIKNGETTIKNITSGDISYTANELSPGTTYTYTIIAKGDDTESEPATGSFTTACEIQWFVNGELMENTSGMIDAEITIPGEQPASCDDSKEFVGWTATPIDGSTDTEPNDLFTTSPGSITGNATYYAVFATQSTGSGSSGYKYIGDDKLLTIGKNYIFVSSKTSGAAFALKASDLPNTGQGTKGTAVAVLVETGAEGVWVKNENSDLEFEAVELGEDYTLRIVSDKDKYLYINGSGVGYRDNSRAYYDQTGLYGWNNDENKWYDVYYDNTTQKFIQKEEASFRVYAYEKSVSTPSSYSGYVTTCCKQPKTPLTITADQIELVKSGVVTLTATGGNGTDITWTATGGELSNQSNTGATLTISDVDATQNITVTATQAENNNDDEVVYCAQEASIDITVKAQWTITFQTNDNGVKNSNSILVTDGESYTMPDISDEYVCNSGSSFAGWVDNEDDTEVDATPNSTQTATADQTWYAAWSSSSTTKSVDIYQLVTNVTNLDAGDKVWITNTTPTVAMGVQNDNNRGQVTVTKHPTESDKIYSTGSPATLTIGKDGTYYTFYDGTGYPTGYLYAASSSKNYLRLQATNNANGKWLITINEGKATITAQGTNTHNKLKYNSSSSIFSCYESGQGDVRIYKKVGTAEIEVSGASITTNNTSCHRGAVISAENGKWITSSKGQKVRIAINVTARGFESDATLSATSANEHFSVVSITNTTITKNSAFETQMMIEYQPAEANTNENAEITLVAKKGEEVVATRTIDVNGRSLPDEFVIVAQYNDKWLAVPANMQSGADQYNGIEVTPNNELTQIPAAPSTTIYSLRGVADNRYEEAGTCVRLVGNGNKCLWGNAASTNTTIQNWTTLASTNGSNYEWLLTTSDGELYTIANPAHPDYNQGRILSNSGSKYGLYKGTTKFYILPVGCSSLPGNIQVTARRVDATFSWEGNASSMQIDIYTNEGMTEGHISNTATASPYYMTGLSESTQYWFEMTPNGTDDACAYTGSFKTTGPTIDVVEWQENAAVIFVDKDEELNPLVIIDGEVEHGVGTGSQATELFFSKYFEAHAENKLLAIYNGTPNTIYLTGYTIKSENGTLDLSQFGQTKGQIAPNEEIILVYFDATYSAASCAERQDNYETWNVLNDKSVLAFSGRGSIGLYKNDVLIDVIGSTFPSGELTKIGKSDSPDNCGTGSDVRLYVEGFSVNDQSSFFCYNGDNIKTPEVENDYAISTNRCLLIRKNSVTSGANAVANNKADAGATCGDLSTTFTTLCSEWSGFRIGGGKSSNEEIKDATCDGLGYVGGFDYNKYYKEYTNIDDDTYLELYTHDDATKEYTIPIDNLAQYSCLNLRFQLKQGDQVLTEEPVQVPIIVSGEKATNDAIFNAIVKTDGDLPVYNQSIERCKTCNVVVLSDATLTKAADGATNDVAEVYNMKVYPGGQVVVPASTEYTVNSLAFRRQEDEVSMANIQGTLNVKHTNGVYLDVRIDPSNWHYMTLPYDCRVGDVTFADGTPAVVNTDYLLGWYDGAYRAEHKTGGWTYITDNDYILKKGLGYIVALPGDGKVRREIRFPMANDVIAEDLTGKTVSGLYAYGGDKTDAELRPNHKGWNMIGSPYLYTYTTDIVKEPLQMGTLEHSPVNPWDGTWVRTGEARYIVEPIDNGWSGYRQTTISNLKPFTSYFIQVGGVKNGEEYTTVTPEDEQQILFAANSVARNASAPRKVAEAEVTDNHPVWYGVEMIAPNNEKDNTTLLISDEFTDGYDMMDDLVKMRGDYYQYYNFPVLASRNNEGEMAFNALPDSTAAKIGVPLNYYAATAGTYTIATDGKFDLEEVKAAMLYDATTAQYTNLLTDNYSFTTNKGNNTNRFTLFVTVERKKVPNITTGMDNLLANGQLSLIAIERTLVLSGLTENADIYVYDMNGKLVTGTHTIGDNGVWRTIVPATGVYFVRVNSANNQQTLRTIVK